MMTSPTVSVLLPVYNAVKYLSQAIESILSQTYKDFEFIIIDDGSNDESYETIRKYSDIDVRIRLFSRENKGLIISLNEGLSYAQGKYIARMDSDDISYPERLQEQQDFLEKNSACVAVGSRVLLIDPEGMPICPFSTQLSHEEIDNAHLALKGGAITHPAVMMRAKNIVEIGGYREDYVHAEDIDLFLRLAEVGRLENLPSTLLQYRMHFESIGNSKRTLQKKSAFRALTDACRRRGLPYPQEVDFAGEQLTRPQLHQKWAWWALWAGNKKTARKHAFIAFWNAPFSITTFKVLVCSIRGH